MEQAAQILSGLESRSSSSAGVDPAEVAELQGNLYKFSRAAWPVTEIGRAFVDGWHLGVLSEHLQAVTELQIHNLVINMPPRHGKSLWAAVFWFAWAWAGDPTTRWLTSSYADDLVTRDAMKAHNLIDSGWYQRRWGHKFGWGKKDTDTWYENNRGGYRISTTVGGKGTGHGGDYLIVDDPMKALDARSAAARLRVIEWWTKTMSTRINDPRSVRKVVIMQRLHEADLAGYLAARQDSDEGYDVLVMPAEHEPKRIFIIRPEPRPRDAIIATRLQRERPELLDPRTQPGELLWADRFGPKQLAALKIELEADGVAGQLQQRPSPADGTIFQRQHFRYAVRAMTALGDTFILYGTDGKEAKRVQVSRCRLFQCIDTAMKAKQHNDPTAVGTFAVTPDGDLLIIHMTSERIEIPFQLAYLKAMRFGPAKWLKLDKRILNSPMPWPRPLLGQWVDDAASGTMLLTSALAEGIVFRTLKCGTADKVQRAAPLSALYEAGRVYHLKDSGPWLVGYEDEAATFPASAHDDRVDVAAYAAQVALYDKIVRAGMAGLEDVAASYSDDAPDPFNPPRSRRPWSLDDTEVPAELPEPAILVDLGDGSDPYESADGGTLTGLVGPGAYVPLAAEDVPEGDWFDLFNEPDKRQPKAPDPPPLPAGPDDPLSLD